MAYSHVTYTSNGGSNYAFPFPYLSPADIFAFVDREPAPFTLLNSSTIQLLTAPAAGKTVSIKRVTSKAEAPVDFRDGSNLLEADLDRLSVWALYTAQESADIAKDLLDMAGTPLPDAVAAAVQANAAAAIATGAIQSLSSDALLTEGAGMVGANQSLAYPNGTLGLSIQLSGIRVDDAPYYASNPALTATQRLVAIHAARDRALALKVPLVFGGNTYVVNTPVRYKTGCVWQFAGMGRTIFRLADTADEDTNVMQPYAYGVETDVTFLGGFTVDGNYGRPTVSGMGSQRPGSSGFITAGTKRLQIIGGVEAKDCVLHGVDICGGGETTGTALDYAKTSLMSPTYYPPNESQHIYIDRIVASNCGDDAVTGHYSKDVYIGRIVASSTGGRHSSVNASNCVELDDGCRLWTIGSIDTVGGNRGVAIKAHAPQPAPSDIQIGMIRARECRQGLYIDQTTDAPDSGRRISVDILVVTRPVKVNDFLGPPSAEYPDGTPNLTPIGAVGVNGSSHVQIGKVIAHATGAETFPLDSAVLVSTNSGNVSINSIDARNWPWNNTASSDIGAVRVASTVVRASFGTIFLRDCGWRGVVDTGATGVTYGAVTGILSAPLTGSLLVRLSTHPASTGGSIGSVVGTGYDIVASYGSSVWTSKGMAVINSHMTVAGHLNAGDAAERTYHTLRHAVPDVAGDLIAAITNNAGAGSVFAYSRGTGATGYNAAAACLKLAVMEGTGRSLAAGGTGNFSGADYAEYIRKAHGCGVIAKGDLVGIDSEGNVTDKWAAAVSFMVKSTDPSIVGGDTWAKHLGDAPEAPADSVQADDEDDEVYFQRLCTDPDLVAYAEAFAAFAAALEEARATVDRIAFAGQVPVNVWGAAAGDYIVPVQDAEGITGVAVKDPSFSQYMAAVGRVLTIESDGRARIAVKVV